MTLHSTRWRTTAALTALVLGAASVATGAGAIASASPSRTAATSTDTSYLADTLGLPANTVVETVTYDRFQWLLQQPGKYAFLVGDPAEDANFKTQAVAVDAAAQTAGVDKIYWFDPNLTGNVTVGGKVTPNLDIRNPTGITTIAAASQTIYGYAWTSLIAQYLGNGLKATVSGVGTESAKVTTAANASVINDATNPLYDYTAGTPTDATDSTFFIYDKDNVTSDATPVADKLVAGVDLDTDASYAADVASAFSSVGGNNIDKQGQFAFWESEVNSKHLAQEDNATDDGGPVLSDSDNTQSDPWAVQQITYPELVHLLNVKTSATTNFVILFGGTWCPNTRAIIQDVNKKAQTNNVTVYNFDTVLDGGTVGGGTTSSTNPLQVRNTVTNGTTTNANPSYVYASILSTYLKNIVTQYDLDNGTYVTFYPNGDTTKPVQAVRKLQVPFLIDYQHGASTNPSSTAIKRQWIQQNTDASTGLPTFTEYMTEYWFSHPSAGRIGLTNSQFPFTITTIPDVAGFDWTNPTYPDSTINTDDAAYLDPSASTTSQTPASLSAALTAVPGSSAFVSVFDVNAALTAANAATTPDTTLVGNLTTIKADWTLAQTRKSNITNALANVAFADEAVAKLGTFFDGLPGGVVSTQTITAPAVKYGVAPTLAVAIANDYGRVPTGTLTLHVNGIDYTQPIVANGASFTLPKLNPGDYDYTLSYPGDTQIASFSNTGTVTVNHIAPKSVTAAWSTKPTSKATGKYKVTVTSPSGIAKATGTVTITFTKGALTETATGTFSKGTVSVKVPKLAKGTWAWTLGWPGDSWLQSYSKASSIKITK